MANMGMVYKGAGPDNYRLYSAYFDGSQWHGDKRIEDQPGGISPHSPHNPGMCLYDNCLYVVYTGVDSNDLFMAWYDGKWWYGDQKISTEPLGVPLSTDASPCLVVFQGKMWVFFKADGSTDICGAEFDGTTWYEGGKIFDEEGFGFLTSEGVEAVAYDDNLFLVYKATDSTDFYVTTFDGTKWSRDTNVQITGIWPRSDHRPAALIYDDRLYLVYTRSGSDQLCVCWFDGAWRGDVAISSQPGLIDARADGHPGMLLFNNRMYLVYKGPGTSDLYSAWYDGATWGGGEAIKEQAGGIRPRSDYSPDLAFFPIPVRDNTSWLAGVDNNMLISEINLPGTHDSAAINTWVPTLYACHASTITAQLTSGVRLLDIRLKVKASGTGYTFATCHGDMVGNEYQSFVSVLDECKAFLRTAGTEFIAMSLKVDDWNGNTDHKTILAALKAVLGKYPVYSRSTMPTLAQVRGRIYLLNRINSDLALGVPISIPDNTSGTWLVANANRAFGVYVQDQYKDLPTSGAEREKLNVFLEALSEKRGGQLLLNFASATYLGIGAVYIMGLLLRWFGQLSADERPTRLGWSLFDYETMSYQTDTYGFVNCVEVIVSSNFRYRGYDKLFRVLGDGKDEL